MNSNYQRLNSWTHRIRCPSWSPPEALCPRLVGASSGSSHGCLTGIWTSWPLCLLPYAAEGGHCHQVSLPWGSVCVESADLDVLSPTVIPCGNVYWWYRAAACSHMSRNHHEPALKNKTYVHWCGISFTCIVDKMRTCLTAGASDQLCRVVLGAETMFSDAT